MAITYSIDGGADAAKFNINGTSGALTFKAAPDFEAPGDANQDNIYEVSVKATDAGGLSTSKLVKVTVTDVSEGSPPQITSAGAVTIKENSTTVMTVTATDPDDTTQPPIEPPIEPPVGTAGDGSANAPAGAANLPDLLNAYAHKPPWKVAGVHYRVGHPTNITLKPPSQLTGISGVSVSGSVATVTQSNVTIDGYDFSGNGGWCVMINNGVSNTKIQNCKFVAGTNSQNQIHGVPGCSNLTLSKCTFDGQGKDLSLGGANIRYRGNGITIEYCLLTSSGGDLFQQVDGGQNSTVIFRYNLWMNAGMASGAHGDFTQLAGGPFNLTMTYNTTAMTAGTTQGLMTEYCRSGETGWNTFTGASRINYYTSLDNSSIATTYTVHDNYFDGGGSAGFVYPNSGPGDGNPRSVYTHNVNMVNGSTISD